MLDISAIRAISLDLDDTLWPVWPTIARAEVALENWLRPLAPAAAALLAQAHALIVDDAALVWVVHDTNPHALSPKVKTFVQAQHWFQDLTQIGLE